MPLQEHLGGHMNKTHLDKGALAWIKDKFNAKTYLDIGCGPGGMVQLAERSGFDVLGVDGDHTLSRYNLDKFIIHDYTTAPLHLDATYDIAWSVEFLEHVYEQYMPNYMATFKCAKRVVITYAPPGWTGHHHVNLQEEEYWVENFTKNGFRLDKELTEELRNNSTMNYPKKPKKAFVRNRGLLFINEQY